MRFPAFFFACITLALPSLAHAEDQPTETPRQGTYVTFGARPYYELGFYTLEPKVAALPSYSARAHGPGAGIDFAIGHSVRPDLFLALDLGASFGSVEQAGDLGGNSLQGSTAGARIGALADWYSSRHVHWMGGFALTGKTFSTTQVAVPGYDDLGDPMVGIHWRAGVGYRAGALDLRLRFDAGTMRAGHVTYVPLVVSTEVAITSF